MLKLDVCHTPSPLTPHARLQSSSVRIHKERHSPWRSPWHSPWRSPWHSPRSEATEVAHVAWRRLVTTNGLYSSRPASPLGVGWAASARASATLISYPHQLSSLATLISYPHQLPPLSDEDATFLARSVLLSRILSRTRDLR